MKLFPYITEVVKYIRTVVEKLAEGSDPDPVQNRIGTSAQIK
jgi:hypothetical protein